MKNIIIIAFLAISFLGKSQGFKKQEQIQAAKVGIITNRLNLSTEQSQQFWAVYNDFESRRKENRKNVKKSLDDATSMAATDEKILAAIKDLQNLKEKEVDLEREFTPKFLKVISVRQYAEFIRTERNFNQILLNQLGNIKNNDDKN